MDRLGSTEEEGNEKQKTKKEAKNKTRTKENKKENEEGRETLLTLDFPIDEICSPDR